MMIRPEVLMLGLLTTLFWSSIYFFGVFQTIMWIVIIISIIVIVIKLQENR